MVTKLILVRHGEIEDNIKKVFPKVGKGQSLTEKGIKQAKSIAERMKNVKIDVIYSSPTLRTLQTAKEINKYHNLKIIESNDIADMNMGILGGVTLIPEKMPANIKIVHEKRKADDSYRPNNGESINDIKKRVSKFLDKIIEENKNKTILVVSHLGTIRVFISVLMGIPYSEVREMKRPENTSYTELEINGKPKLITLGYDEHLKDL